MSVDRMRQDRSSDDDSSGGSGTPRVYATEKTIHNDIPNIMRIVSPNNYEKYYRAWPVCDDGKKRPYIIENEHEGLSVLARILGDRNNYYRGGFLESKKDSMNKKYFVYEKVAPELFMWINKNNDPTGKEGSWKAKKEFMFNIIDRDVEYNDAKQPVNWCKDNKHTKLLRMGATGFDSLVDTRDNDGNLDEYDVNYTKKGKGTETTHSIRKAGAQFPTACQGALTNEELAYVTYDLKQESKLSSATYVLKYLKDKITSIDEVMGTHFIDELVAQSAIEKEQWGVDNAQPEPSDVDTVSDKVDAPTQAPAQAVSQPVVPPRMRAASAAAGAKPLVPCGGCQAMIPSDAEVCPVCKVQLVAPCDNPECAKMFSTFATSCPHCGKTY